MMPLLPIVECLQNVADDAERARWLLVAPTSILLREEPAIRRILQAAGCLWGVSVLDVELAAMLSVRDPLTGDVPENLRQARDLTRSELKVIAGVIARGGVAQ